MAQALIAACVIWTAASVIAIGIRAQPLTPWNIRDGSGSMFARWVGIELSGYLVEIIAVGLSIHFVWGLNMPLKKRLSVSAIFAFRLLVAPVIAIRLWLLSPSSNPTPNNPNVPASVFTQATLQLTFVLASITCLKPFLRPFHSGYAVSAAPSGGYNATFNTGGYSTGGKRSRNDPYVDLSTAGKSAATTSQLSRRGRVDGKDGGAIVLTDITTSPSDEVVDDRDGEAPLVVRPDYQGHVTSVITHGSGGSEAVRPPSKKMSISMTKEWGVRYDDRGHHRGPAGRAAGGN
ncbi:hypothetical protein LTR86_006822 [Recurvomyces mirabilis]|nr:hypothetical protein LTR86_006822 [Recurvomyces mirabilis]